MGAVIRNKIADYLNTSKTEVPEYKLMGKGFNSLDEAPQAQTEEKAYISDASMTKVIKGYQVQFAFDSDLMDDEDTILALYRVGRNQLQGGEAEMDYVRVDLFDKTAEGNAFPARKFRVAVQVDDISGAGAEIIHITGVLGNVGSMELGTFNTQTKIFTPDTGVPTP